MIALSLALTTHATPSPMHAVWGQCRISTWVPVPVRYKR